ncbi:hypothetical protein ACQP2F_13245 [Actinoplanes sp. CA-030573]|uniref:hypothetical protein n=1 Tax=Actinoplanes sp. CA-030573 TaxID=3239898 RepID=UPI003D8EC86A
MPGPRPIRALGWFRAAPTPDHFIAALYLAGLAAADREADTSGAGGSSRPPAGLPPDGSNI